MSPHRFMQVLALVGEDERENRAVVDRAIELAEVERACLTLAMTTDPGRLIRWCAPWGALSRPCAWLDYDAQPIAVRRLTALAAEVPGTVALRTVVLDERTVAGLRRLMAGGSYDLLVAGARTLSRSRGLRHAINQAQVCLLTVKPDPAPSGQPSVRRHRRARGAVPA